jgi:hypothetical protein
VRNTGQRQSREVITQPPQHRRASTEHEEDSDEYEEVVTDDDEENPSKRQKTDRIEPEEPVEFDEDDITYQLAAMGQDWVRSRRVRRW